MSARVKEIVRRGKWVYGDAAPSEVLIFRQNYIEGPRITDEEPTPGYPPFDRDGMFYYAAYALSGGVRGVSNACGSADEAVKLAERTIQGPISWESFKEQWNEYRKRRNWLLFAVLGFLVALPLADYLGHRVLQSEAVFACLAVSWMAFCGVSVMRLMYWHCPRCGAWFGATWWYRNPLARRCVHCRLPKYSDC